MNTPSTHGPAASILGDLKEGLTNSIICQNRAGYISSLGVRQLEVAGIVENWRTRVLFKEIRCYSA